MSRVAVISDIHANIQALEAVMADFAGVDDVLCLGDVVGYGADPVRCIDMVREAGWLCLTGNHDRACTDPDILEWFNIQAARAIRWTIEAIGEERRGWLRERPELAERDGVRLVHASLRDPIYEYILDGATAAANLALLGDGVAFHGHSHLPGMFHVTGDQVDHNYWKGRVGLAGPALVNPGSVGQPRDGDPDASYGVWDTTSGVFEFRRVPYDREGAQRAIMSAGLPERFALRLDRGL